MYSCEHQTLNCMKTGLDLSLIVQTMWLKHPPYSIEILCQLKLLKDVLQKNNLTIESGYWSNCCRFGILVVISMGWMQGLVRRIRMKSDTADDYNGKRNQTGGELLTRGLDGIPSLSDEIILSAWTLAKIPASISCAMDPSTESVSLNLVLSNLIVSEDVEGIMIGCKCSL